MNVKVFILFLWIDFYYLCILCKMHFIDSAAEGYD